VVPLIRIPLFADPETNHLRSKCQAATNSGSRCGRMLAVVAWRSGSEGVAVMEREIPCSAAAA
jgi:hypothetical protein